MNRPRVAAFVLVLFGLAASVAGQSTLALGPYAYDGAGNIRAIGTDVFTYDAFGRLMSGMAGAGGTQSYTYDGFGNLLSISTNGATPPEVQLQSGATNRVTSAVYDEAGQLREYVADRFAYDGAGMVTQSTIDGATKIHLYSASDERVATITAQNNAEVRSDWSMRDASGRVLRRLSREAGVWSWREDYIYRGGQLLAAEVNAPEGTRHFHLDHLGTPRLITDRGGNELSRHTYFPFGQEVTPRNASGERLKFTGHERDFGAGHGSDLDYMHARYYRVGWGRFLSADPGRDWDMHQPQSWNMYAYVRNNPINRIDPTGRCGESPNLIGPRLPCATLAPPKDAENWPAERRAAENAKNARRDQLAQEGEIVVNRAQERPSSAQVAKINGGPAPAGSHLDHTQELVLNGPPRAKENIAPLDATVNTSNGKRVGNAIAGFADGTRLGRFHYTVLNAGGVVMTLVQARSYNTFMANQEKAHPGYVNMNDMARWVFTGDTRPSSPPCGTSGGGYC